MDYIDPADHAGHQADVKRAAVAMWLAVLAEDLEGAVVLAESTPCVSCQSIQTVVAGLFAALDARLSGDGRILLRRADRARLERVLRGLLATVRDRGEVSR